MKKGEYDWEKLEVNKCPAFHCQGRVVKNHQYNNIYHCEWCMFQIAGQDIKKKINDAKEFN